MVARYKVSEQQLRVEPTEASKHEINKLITWPHLCIVIVVRHLPVIGASRTIITTAGRAIVAIAGRVAGVVERAQI